MIRFVWIVAVLTCLAGAGYSDPAPKNLLANPKFDQGEGERPAGWAVQMDVGKVSGVWDPADPATGKRSVRLTVEEKGQADWRPAAGFVPVEAAKRYTLAGRMWAAIADDAAADLEAQWFDAAGKFVGRAAVAPAKAKEWQPVALRGLKPPDGAVKAIVLFRAYAPGTYRLSEVSFAESDPVDVDNVLRNGGFEEDADGDCVPDGWLLSPNHPQFPKESGTWDRAAGESSPASVRVVSADAKVTPYWYQGKLRLEPEKRYSLTFFVKAALFGEEYRAYVEWVRDGKVVGGRLMQWEQASTGWQRKTLLFSTPPELMDTAYVVLQGRPGTLWFDNAKLALVEEEAVTPPLALTMLAPHYRNTIYATQKVPAIRLSARTDKPVAAGRLSVVLKGAQGKEVARKGIAWAGREMALEMPAAGLAVGDYTLEAVLQADGKEYGRAAQPLRKLAPFSPEVRVREDNVVLVDGRPFWPIGITQLHADPETCKRLGDNGFNLFIPNGVSAVTGVLRRSTRLAAQYGLYVMDWNNGHCYPAGRIDAQKQRETARRDVANAKGIPGFLGWMVDESIWNGVPLADVRRYYEEMTAADPFHLVWNNHAPRNTVKELAECNRYTDVSGSDVYPVPEPQTHSDLPNATISVVGDETRKLIRTVEGRKPIWMILQAFGWNDWEKDPALHKRRPTWPETRFMAYDAIIHGADGIIYWGSQYLEKDAELWRHLYRVTGELRDLTGALVCPDDPKAATLVAPGERVAMRVKRTPEGLLLLVENASPKAQRVRVRLAKAPAGPVPVLFEERSLNAAGGVLEEEFPPYTVHAYSLAKRLPAPLLVPRVPSGDADTTARNLDTLTLAGVRRGVWKYAWRAQWIWHSGVRADGTAPDNQEVYLRSRLQCAGKPESSLLLVTADNEYDVFVNGKKAGSDREERNGGWWTVDAYDITTLLREGPNEIAIQAANGTGPAGVLLEAKFSAGGKTTTLASGEGWEVSLRRPAGWPATEGGEWGPARALGRPPAQPWGDGLVLTEGTPGS